MLSSLTSLNSQELSRLLKRGTHKIYVTNEMVELYELITRNEDPVYSVFLEGPPGSGKTTTLYWLYQQLVVHRGYKPIAVPIRNLDECSSEILSAIVPAFGSQIVLCIDLIEPANEDNWKLLFKLIDSSYQNPNVKIVFAVSSLFRVFLTKASS